VEFTAPKLWRKARAKRSEKSFSKFLNIGKYRT